MKYYVKVTETVAKAILSNGVALTKTKDGNCLLYQSEVNSVEGDNLAARAAFLGGSLVPEVNALAEINGTIETPATCYTPKQFGGDDNEETPTTDEPAGGNTSTNVGDDDDMDSDTNKEESEVNNE